MIAVNMMDIDVEVIKEEDDPGRAAEVFAKGSEDVLPVLKGDGRLAGVLWREDLEALPRGSWGGSVQGGRVMDTGLVRGDYTAAGPMAPADEIREKLASGRGGGGGKAGASGAFVYIVDGHGRLLGRVGPAEVELRRKASEEALS